MIKKTIGFLFIIGFIFSGCSTKEYFGKLSEKEIIEFIIEKQMGATQFKGDSIFVHVPDNNSLYLSASSIKVSDYASVSPKVGEKQDFSQPVPYTVYAEDGSSKVYYVKVIVVSNSGNGEDTSGFQLPNSSFDLWYETSQSQISYFEIGENDQEKTWATGNQGVASAKKLGSTADFPSVRHQTGPNKYAAELTTQNMGPLAAGAIGGHKGIAAGNIYLGAFVIANLFDAHSVFGYPYSGKPTSFQVDYKYTPAPGLLDGKLNPVAGEDKLDMYLILEKREGNQVKRLGVAWFRSGDVQTEWKTIVKDIKYAYGSAPAGLEDHEKRVLKFGVDGNQAATNPAEMPYAVWGDIATETPTHILVTFTSSYQGDYFIGAPGSKLIVDNFKLIY
ncbi:MAG: PCMD domain-containing protein [Bacteroidales bacterium]|nr:PCMD domain-containing protein [Bacteroidales bacterium]MDY0215644.1 PCMD domain-containing protein [Bacteroidales bacterium]